MSNPTITIAIRSKNLLRFSYDFSTRVVEPHAYGETDQENHLLRAYQRNGRPGWRLFREDEMHGIKIVPDTFPSIRPGYKRNDTAMERIFQQL